MEAPENGPQKHGKKHLTILVPSSDFGQCQGQLYQVLRLGIQFLAPKKPFKDFKLCNNQEEKEAIQEQTSFSTLKRRESVLSVFPIVVFFT